MKRPYATALRVAELRAGLTGEEWAVLRDVATMRVAVATDLQALRALDGPVSVRRFRRLLARLTEQSVIVRLERRVGGRSSGSAGFVYGLGLAGQRLLIDEASARLRQPWTPRAAWLAHALAVGHLYVRLRELDATGQAKLERFDAEPRCWRRFMGSHGAPVALKPDAYVLTFRGDYESHHFVEVDCGTESPATLSRKFDAYRQYWQSGTEQLRHEVFPQVLWLVPDERRRAVLTDVAGRQPPESWLLHRITTYDRFADALAEEPP